ncbi:unnamed protein product [Lota lota]
MVSLLLALLIQRSFVVTRKSAGGRWPRAKGQASTPLRLRCCPRACSWKNLVSRLCRPAPPDIHTRSPFRTACDVTGPRVPSAAIGPWSGGASQRQHQSRSGRHSSPDATHTAGGRDASYRRR